MATKRKKILHYNSSVTIHMMTFDNKELQTHNQIARALERYGFEYKMKLTREGTLYGNTYEFKIECHGVRQIAICYTLIGGEPDYYNL